jgi:hypothetical protein
MKKDMATRHPARKAGWGEGTARKGKRTFSLSMEALAYLKVLAKNHRSTSEALDRLIREKKEEAEKEKISANIRGYYDSISEEERAENLAWGEFVQSHLGKD